MTAPETNVRQDEDLLGGTKPNAGDTPVLVIVKDAEVIAATPVLVVTPS